MGLFFYTQKSSIISTVGLPTTEIIEPESQAMLGYIFQVVLFAIYFGITIFFHLRKPKEKPSTAVNSTDI